MKQQPDVKNDQAATCGLETLIRVLGGDARSTAMSGDGRIVHSKEVNLGANLSHRGSLKNLNAWLFGGAVSLKLHTALKIRLLVPEE